MASCAKPKVTPATSSRRTKTRCSSACSGSVRTPATDGQARRRGKNPWHWRKEGGLMTNLPRKVRAPDLAQMKARGERIVMLTAYDATLARLLDRAGIDLLLVGDSLGQVILGLDTTIPVTLDAVIHHTRAVTRGASRALVVADMPFLTYQVSAEEALRSAARLLQEGGAAAVKLEVGRP